MRKIVQTVYRLPGWPFSPVGWKHEKIVSSQCGAGRRYTVCEQLISKSRIFRRISLSGTVIWSQQYTYGHGVLNKVVSMVAHFLQRCTSLKRTVSQHRYLLGCICRYVIHVHTSSNCRRAVHGLPDVDNLKVVSWIIWQADSAAKQLISKRRILKGRSLDSAMIWRSHDVGEGKSHLRGA